MSLKPRVSLNIRPTWLGCNTRQVSARRQGRETFLGPAGAVARNSSLGGGVSERRASTPQRARRNLAPQGTTRQGSPFSRVVPDTHEPSPHRPSVVRPMGDPTGRTTRNLPGSPSPGKSHPYCFGKRCRSSSSSFFICASSSRVAASSLPSVASFWFSLSI